MVEVEPPGDQRDERGACGGRDRGRAVVADHRDSDRAGVEPLRVRADHRPGHAAVAAFEDLAVLVDEEVVADVVPTVPLHMVELDRLHDRGRLRLRVRVRSRRVVDDREVDRVRVVGRRATNRLVRVPAGPRDDRRRACQVGPLRGRGLPRSAHEVGTQPGDAPHGPVLDRVRRACPERARDAPAASRAQLAPAVGERVLRREHPPRAPAASEIPRPVLDQARPTPVDTDELEHLDRDRAARRLRRKISSREPGTESRTGEGGSEDGCEEKRLHRN